MSQYKYSKRQWEDCLRGKPSVAPNTEVIQRHCETVHKMRLEFFSVVTFTVTLSQLDVREID